MKDPPMKPYPSRQYADSFPRFSYSLEGVTRHRLPIGFLTTWFWLVRPGKMFGRYGKI